MSCNRLLPPRACVYVWSGAGPLGVGVAPPCVFSLVSSPPPHWFRSQQGVSRVWSFWTELYVQASDNRYTHIVPATITFYLPSHRDPQTRTWSAWGGNLHLGVYLTNCLRKLNKSVKKSEFRLHKRYLIQRRCLGRKTGWYERGDGMLKAEQEPFLRPLQVPQESIIYVEQ